ncbi:hypothetical protein KDH_19470 [Dictyobacter sp. S3.2.2.5]|uniref:Uncharacterized protein n=1 Tax=Dictyobacter halimunensis TaxID=3026934 RepID=A0ABQ6FNB5_9CHLR|nr:hypothetical protein KDH_19470 [Dictyobacter sp. S3.2.2.5]
MAGVDFLSLSMARNVDAPALYGDVSFDGKSDARPEPTMGVDGWGQKIGREARTYDAPFRAGRCRRGGEPLLPGAWGEHAGGMLKSPTPPPPSPRRRRG